MLLRFWFWLMSLCGRDPRGIFWFWDGRRWRGVDPIATTRLLLTDPEFSWEETPLLTNDDDPVVVTEALQACAAAARRAFGIKPFEEGGLTEAECCRILFAFRDYLGDLKKNGSGPQTSPEPTGATFSAESPTKSGSDSGSTGKESDSSEPGTPDSEQLPPQTEQ